MSYLKLNNKDYINAFRTLFNNYVYETFPEESNQEILDYNCPFHTDIYETIYFSLQVDRNNILKNTVNEIKKKDILDKEQTLFALFELVNSNKETFQNKYLDLLLYSSDDL